jgi:hypothetical protein
MIDAINEKWSEDMPVLYEIAIFLQDEFMETYFEQEGYGDHPKDAIDNKNVIKIEFKDAQ